MGYLVPTWIRTWGPQTTDFTTELYICMIPESRKLTHEYREKTTQSQNSIPCNCPVGDVDRFTMLGSIQLSRFSVRYEGEEIEFHRYHAHELCMVILYTGVVELEVNRPFPSDHDYNTLV